MVVLPVLASAFLQGFSGAVYADVSSAYISSSGSVCDICPVAAQELDLSADFGEWGELYWCGWLGSALHRHQRESHRELFFEFEMMTHYVRTWKLADEATLRTAVGWYNDPQIGYPEDSNAYHGPQAVVSLENPYLTPYVDLVGIIDPGVFARARVGLRRTVELNESWSITPSVETVWSDRHRYQNLVGDLPGTVFLDGVFTSITANVRTEWRFAEQWSLYLNLAYLTTLDPDLRRVIKSRTEYWSKCDWPSVTVGIAYFWD